MKTQKFTVQLYIAFIALILLMSLTPISGTVGAVWTTDGEGVQQDGNNYLNPQDVYINVRFDESVNGTYWFIVTDTQGNNLSSDPDFDRWLDVSNGEIVDSGHATEDVNGNKVVQLWPFEPHEGTYKVWVSSTTEFLPSNSKTDNFSVEPVSKFFDLFVTENVSNLENVAFYANYKIEGDEDWTSAKLVFDREVAPHQVFRQEASFFIGIVIDWYFSIDYVDHLGRAATWKFETETEVINSTGMINDKTVFLVDGYKYNSSNHVVENTIAKLYDYENDQAMMNPLDNTTTNSEGYFAFIAAGPGYYTISCEAWDANSETFYWTLEDCVIDQTYTFKDSDLAEIKVKLKGTEITDDFDVVFTKDKKSGGYKLSSTNMGSFHFYTIKYGNPNETFKIEIILPPTSPDSPNLNSTDEPAEYDYPNFTLAHTRKGEIDVHVYKGDTESHTGDITNAFDITTVSTEYDPSKYVKVNGTIPEDCNSVLIKVHMAFQIDATLTWDEVLAFYDFEYWFTVIHNPRGVRSVRGVR